MCLKETLAWMLFRPRNRPVSISTFAQYLVGEREAHTIVEQNDSPSEECYDFNSGKVRARKQDRSNTELDPVYLGSIAAGLTT